MLMKREVSLSLIILKNILGVNLKETRDLLLF